MAVAKIKSDRKAVKMKWFVVSVLLCACLLIDEASRYLCDFGVAIPADDSNRANRAISVPFGTIIMYGGSNDLSNQHWLYCNGQLLSTSQNPELFACEYNNKIIIVISTNSNIDSNLIIS